MMEEYMQHMYWWELLIHTHWKTDQIVFQELIRNNLDIPIITKTWLNNSDENRAWSQLTYFNHEPYRLLTLNMKTGKGGPCIGV